MSDERAKEERTVSTVEELRTAVNELAPNTELTLHVDNGGGTFLIENDLDLRGPIRIDFKCPVEIAKGATLTNFGRVEFCDDFTVNGTLNASTVVYYHDKNASGLENIIYDNPDSSGDMRGVIMEERCTVSTDEDFTALAADPEPDGIVHPGYRRNISIGGDNSVNIDNDLTVSSVASIFVGAGEILSVSGTMDLGGGTLICSGGNIFVAGTLKVRKESNLYCPDCNFRGEGENPAVIVEADTAEEAMQRMSFAEEGTFTGAEDMGGGFWKLLFDMPAKVSTIDGLKAALKQHRREIVIKTEGDGNPFTVTEDIEIPEGCDVSVRCLCVFDTGVTVTNRGSFSCDYGSEFKDGGRVINYDYFNAGFLPAENIRNIDKIIVNESGSVLTRFYASSMDELISVNDVVFPHDVRCEADMWGSAVFTSDFTLNTSFGLYLREGLNVAEGAVFTIPAGCKVSVFADSDINGTAVVNGKLISRKIEDGQPGTRYAALNFASDDSFSGTGRLLVCCNDGTAKDDALQYVTGLDINDADRYEVVSDIEFVFSCWGIQHKGALAPDEHGVYHVKNCDELQKLLEKDLPNLVAVSESDFVFDRDITVPQGAQFTFVGQLSVKPGTVLTNNGFIQFYSSLNTEGKLINNGTMWLYAPETSKGLDRIENYCTIYIGKDAFTEEDLHTYAAEQPPSFGGDGEVTVNISTQRPITLTSSLSLDSAHDLDLFYNMTVASGAVLTVDSCMSSQTWDGAVSVIFEEGSALELNGNCFLYGEGKAVFKPGSELRGTGSFFVESSCGTEALMHIEGVPGSRFTQTKDEYGYFLQITDPVKISNLRWGTEYGREDGIARPRGGALSFDREGGSADAQFYIYYYKKGENGGEDKIIRGDILSGSEIQSGKAGPLSSHSMIDAMALDGLENGTYYATVKAAAADGTADEQVFTSPDWVYEKPDKSLPQVKNLTLVPGTGKTAGDYFLKFDRLEDETDVYGYAFGIMPEDGSGLTSYCYGRIAPSDRPDYLAIHSDYLRAGGYGELTVGIYAVSSDENVICSGTPAEFTFTLEDPNGPAKKSIHEMAADTSEKTPEEVRQEVRSVENISGLMDVSYIYSVGEDISTLEKKTGTEVRVETAPGLGLEAEEVSVLGTALNDPVDAEKPMTLKITEPAPGVQIPDKYDGKDAVGFAMTVENMENTKELQVPMRIRIPAAEGMAPSNTVLLHYKDGSDVPEELPFEVEWYNNVRTLSFVVDGFSEFWFAERLPEPVNIFDINDDGRLDAMDAVDFMKNLTGDQAGAEIDLNGDDEFNIIDLIALMQEISK